jgi:hypothetical protein
MTNQHGFIGTIQVLKRQTRRDEALFMLQKVASMVKPIMKKHGFKVNALCEFCPKNASLLGINVNHGMKICLRLRPQHSKSEFLPLEAVIGTMLHELTHNKFGPHDKSFYSFLDTITTELEGLMSQGFKGDGFFSPGHALGGSRTVGRAEMAQVAAAQAERRRLLYGGSGQKLGGSRGEKGLSVQDQVRMTWVRKQEDEKWCGGQKSSSEIDDKMYRDELGMDEEVVVIERESGGSDVTPGMNAQEPVSAKADNTDGNRLPSKLEKPVDTSITDEDEIIEIDSTTFSDSKRKNCEPLAKKLKKDRRVDAYIDLTE